MVFFAGYKQSDNAEKIQKETGQIIYCQYFYTDFPVDAGYPQKQSDERGRIKKQYK